MRALPDKPGLAKTIQEFQLLEIEMVAGHRTHERFGLGHIPAIEIVEAFKMLETIGWATVGPGRWQEMQYGNNTIQFVLVCYR